MKKIIPGTEFQNLIQNLATQFYSEQKDLFKSKKTSICIIGIQTRGVYLAERIARTLKQKYHLEAEAGSLDITLYRDDVSEIGQQPLVKESNVPFSIEGKIILLVDDVLYTGRTIRAALDALLELGRPKLIRLAVMVDRGEREYPIQADYVGTQVLVKSKEEVQLKVKEVDGIDGIWTLKKGGNK